MGVNVGIEKLNKILNKRNQNALIFQVDLESAFDSISRINMFEILKEKWGN
jgi:hypothetical protein